MAGGCAVTPRVAPQDSHSPTLRINKPACRHSDGVQAPCLPQRCGGEQPPTPHHAQITAFTSVVPRGEVPFYGCSWSRRTMRVKVACVRRRVLAYLKDICN